MVSKSSKIRDFVLGPKTDDRPSDLNTRAQEVLEPADIFLDQEPTIGEWIKELAPTRDGSIHYVQSLFPSASWIWRYCPRWLLGDVIAGLTIGMVVIPQAMAYAVLAQLDPAYGLYTSFTGAVLYWVFGTSKDIVIGTTAVGSLLVGQVVTHVQESAPGKYENQEIARALSLLSGAIMLFLGLLRLGWIIEFIPYIPISAFVTAASITIMSTQVPTALGIKGINTREAPYKVIINTLKGLPNAKLDAAIGVTSIVLLFAIRDFCAMMEKRQPARKRQWSFISSLRLTFTMILYTLISYLVNRTEDLTNPKFKVVGHIEAGFKQASVPNLDPDLLVLILPELPAIVIILIIEHIAIAKAMGRMFNYTIIPSQEIVALGAANLFSPFVGGYVCTGSFGASAVLSKAGVRTPLAGLFSAGILVLALYVLTSVFAYIPNAALAGLIIHAVCNLIAPPKNLYKYWKLSPFELIIWVICVLLAIFESLETSIYVGIALSFVMLLIRLSRTKGEFLGRTTAQEVVGKNNNTAGGQDSSENKDACPNGGNEEREVYLPLSRNDASNSNIKLETPYPGVIIYRFVEGFNYTNQALHIRQILEYVEATTQRTSEEHFEKKSDRLWNNPGPKMHKSADLPFLHAVVLDFSSVNNLDVTSVQGLVDLRASLDRYCSPDSVELHFANVHNRWTRRALTASGFGYPSSKNSDAIACWQPAYTIAAVLDPELNENRPKTDLEANETSHTDTETETIAPTTVSTNYNTITPSQPQEKQKMAAVHGVDRPFFHADLHTAVKSAVRDAMSRDARTGPVMESD
ncbi:unnamed protein product [Clonostachys solani]|uniref:STAS domain-containing protein n=1 Tax=Clonostachys solani TaxID=160281 RepID=A0A9P0EBV3_9HYPO|nr:unnamed protein product [Clonostachys solani]